MHTYRKDHTVGGTIWMVEFVTSVGSRIVRGFDAELDAALFTNFLNGGDTGISASIEWR